MPGARDYTDTTRTALAVLSRGSCYFPGCERPVIVMLDDEPYVDVQIAHIYDANVGNRHDPNMTDDQRRDFSNLILLCKPHHNLVDKRHPDRFPAQVLRAWKSEREAYLPPIEDRTAVLDTNLEQALTTGALIAINSGVVQVGGTGGSAVAAGGGGGGVIGSGQGGQGGPGGVIHIDDGVRIDLTGTDVAAPGAGGGGGGLLLPGELSRTPRPDGTEGTGHSDGIDGQDGGASSIGTPDGEILIEASGGQGGLAGTGIRGQSEALRLSMFTLANSTEIRDNLLFLLGAGWQSYSTLNIGDRVQLCIALLFEAGSVEPGEYTIRVMATDPSGRTAASVSIPVTVEIAGDVVRIPRVVPVELTVSSFGLWRLTAESDAGPIGIVDLMVKRTGVS